MFLWKIVQPLGQGLVGLGSTDPDVGVAVVLGDALRGLNIARGWAKSHIGLNHWMPWLGEVSNEAMRGIIGGLTDT